MFCCFVNTCTCILFLNMQPNIFRWQKPGAAPGFQVRGGGALKKIASSGEGRENVWGISCETYDKSTSWNYHMFRQNELLWDH